MIGKSLKTTKQLKVFIKKLPPTLPPVGTKTCPAVEGGARPQVNHLTLRALDLISTDPLPACTMEENLIAVEMSGPWKLRTRPSNSRRIQGSQEGAGPLFKTLDQAPTSLSHPYHHRSPRPGASLSPAQVVQQGVGQHPVGAGKDK